MVDRLIILLCLLIGFSSCSYDILYKSSFESLNQTDYNGERIDKWIVQDSVYIDVLRYRNGLEHGKYIKYYKDNGQLATYGRYKKGKKSGIWYDFTYKGSPVSVRNFRRFPIKIRKTHYYNFDWE